MDRSPDPPAAGATGDGQAERLGGLEVDHELELGRLLDREVAGLGTTKDLVNVTCGAAILLKRVRAVRDETICLDK